MITVFGYDRFIARITLTTGAMMLRRTDPGPLLSHVVSQLGCTASTLSTALQTHLLPPAASLPAPPAHDRDAWQSASAPELIRHALADKGTPWPQPLAHDAARVFSDGDRNTWEQNAFARVQRSSRSVIAAALTGDEIWRAEILDGVILLCEQSSWCWPAHDEARAKRGWVLPDVAAPVLDLGAGEIAAHLAWLDHLLGAELEATYPGVQTRIRHEVRSRVLDPFVTRDDWWWMGDERTTINWTPWILGNVLTAALRLLDSPDDAALRAQIVCRVIVGLDRYVADLPDDGAVDEGYQYWWAGAARLLEALDLLGFATHDAIDPLGDISTLRETIAFPYRMHLGDHWFVSVSDARARALEPQPWHVLARAGRRVGDSHALDFARSQHPVLDASETMGLGRLSLALTDEHANHSGRAPLPERVWLPSTQLLIVREAAGERHGLAVAAKGGHNDESHNHNDVGSVIVTSDGVPVIVDAGRPTYTAQTFSDDRYALWMMQSAWHNVPVIAGHTQPTGPDFAARAATAENDALSLELASAYGLGGRVRWNRTTRLDRSARCVTVHDSWTWLDDTLRHAGSSQVRVLLAGRVALDPGAAHVVPLGGATPVDITWNSSAPAALTTQHLDDPLLIDVWGETLTRLDIDVSALSELIVTIRQDCSGGER
ncbi:heparinase II/III domain-containing protein [Paramicrobacterium fandaimingii]|uniref:heparinase II/III domain-containing protein n=1 Tax=Paramicrobacterium fandaimingii TaxID=2708079 RepID=UPI00141FBE33|nr:heparinase II/III family protein [Microbacterium fandaimingii]